MVDRVLSMTNCAVPLAREALGRSPVPALRGLRIEEGEDTIVIRGTVSSFYHKQLAQETVRPLLGQRKLLNCVEVAYPPRGPQG